MYPHHHFSIFCHSIILSKKTLKICWIRWKSDDVHHHQLRFNYSSLPIFVLVLIVHPLDKFPSFSPAYHIRQTNDNVISRNARSPVVNTMVTWRWHVSHPPTATQLHKREEDERWIKESDGEESVCEEEEEEEKEGGAVTCSHRLPFREEWRSTDYIIKYYFAHSRLIQTRWSTCSQARTGVIKLSNFYNFYCLKYILFITYINFVMNIKLYL